MPKFEVRGDRVNSDLSLGNWRNTGILLGLQPYTGAGLTNGATLPSFSQAHFNYLEPQSIMSDGDPNDARLWGHLLALDAIMQYWDEKENNTGWWAWIFSKKENPYKDEYLHAFTSTSAYQRAVMTGNLMLVFAGGGGGSTRGVLRGAAAGGRAMKLPTYDWGLAGTNIAGETAVNGAVTLRPGMSWAQQAHVLKHEGVHAFLSVKDGAFLAGVRQEFGIWGYRNSQFLRFAEEALAEGFASRSLLKGLAHPVVNPYGITVRGLFIESTAVGSRRRIRLLTIPKRPIT